MAQLEGRREKEKEEGKQTERDTCWRGRSAGRRGVPRAPTAPRDRCPSPVTSAGSPALWIGENPNPPSEAPSSSVWALSPRLTSKIPISKNELLWRKQWSQITFVKCRALFYELYTYPFPSSRLFETGTNVIPILQTGRRRLGSHTVNGRAGSHGPCRHTLVSDLPGDGRVRILNVVFL